MGGSGVSAGGLAGDLIGGAVAGAAGAMVFNALSGDEKPEEKAGEEVKP